MDVNDSMFEFFVRAAGRREALDVTTFPAVLESGMGAAPKLPIARSQKLRLWK
jgi:hypothetical protein